MFTAPAPASKDRVCIASVPGRGFFGFLYIYVNDQRTVEVPPANINIHAIHSTHSPPDPFKCKCCKRPIAACLVRMEFSF